MAKQDSIVMYSDVVATYMFELILCFGVVVLLC